MPSEFDRDLKQLEVEIRKLEVEYNMFFAGQLPRPPWETRTRVETLIKRYDRAYIQNYADRFRFSTIQSRYVAFSELWERALRAREEGRPGPFFKPRTAERGGDQPAATGGDRVLLVTTLADPDRESDKLHQLYERISEARREVGEDNPPYHKFVQLIKTQVKRSREAGSPEVAFRVAVKDGKVNFTARALKGVKMRDES